MVALLLLALSVGSAGALYALRWKVDPEALLRPPPTAKGGNSAPAPALTEVELQEAVQGASRKALVAGVLKGAVGVPLGVLALGVVLWLCGVLFETPASFGQCMAAASIGLLPLALSHGLFAVSAASQPLLSDKTLETLLPTHLGLLVEQSSRWQPLWASLDFFKIWSVALIGRCFSEVSGMRVTRALLLSLSLYVMYVALFVVGLPALRMAAPQ